MAILGHAARERSLLVLCASPTPSQEQLIGAASDENLDWELLLDLADRHAITPLLYWRLNSFNPDVLPGALGAAFQKNVCRNLWLTRELLELHQLLEREGIQLMPFKGPTLALVAYGNLALRQFVDLDLLVRKSDALHARELLLANGYRSILQLSPRREQAYLDVYDEFVLSSEDGHCLVELHWAVTPSKFSIPLDTLPFWKCSESVCIGNTRVSCLGLEDLLLVLCVHGAKHCWSHLSLIADVAWLIAKRPEVNWETFLERARAIGSLRIALLGLSLANGILQAPLPEAVLRTIKNDRATKALANRVVAGFAALDDEPNSMLRAALFHMKVRERWQDRVRYFCRLATTPGVEDWQIVDFPPGLAFLYWFLRYPRLMGKYCLRPTGINEL